MKLYILNKKLKVCSLYFNNAKCARYRYLYSIFWILLSIHFWWTLSLFWVPPSHDIFSNGKLLIIQTRFFTSSEKSKPCSACLSIPTYWLIQIFWTFSLQMKGWSKWVDYVCVKLARPPLPASVTTAPLYLYSSLSKWLYFKCLYCALENDTISLLMKTTGCK